MITRFLLPAALLLLVLAFASSSSSVSPGSHPARHPEAKVLAHAAPISNPPKPPLAAAATAIESLESREAHLNAEVVRRMSGTRRAPSDRAQEVLPSALDPAAPQLGWVLVALAIIASVKLLAEVITRLLLRHLHEIARWLSGVLRSLAGLASQ